ncbi:Spermine/spermidine acetyltransferase [Hyella patelloides LEGE 07179]|uniref:Spermine/spermidine acetyltransferase n=1 Tax=Hyella patelloides LEGE 07179 TaxID=945734 RepID=A0A563VVY9_9CYAN|nr:GNAT family N-acetyltransferase [Hyella patelloides]VEP15580.1 Spermine/spermidine acetyltransferase [Hyella patelloides LEGE 07179]
MVLSSAIVTLQEITKENLDNILDLKVTSEQENFVASNAVSIAQAHFYPEVAWFRAIYVDEVPVGFVMLVDDQVNSSYYLWRFMIDARFQKHGFGQRTLKLVLKYAKTRPGAKELLTSCVTGDGSPGKFYEKMGFTDTGDMDEDGEMIMQYKF